MNISCEICSRHKAAERRLKETEFQTSQLGAHPDVNIYDQRSYAAYNESTIARSKRLRCQRLLSTHLTFETERIAAVDAKRGQKSSSTQGLTDYQQTCHILRSGCQDSTLGIFVEGTTLRWRPQCVFHQIPRPMPTTLKELVLQHQNITSIRVGDFRGLQFLETLRICDSHIVTIQPGCFEGLPRVQQIDLSRNSIKRLEAKTFKGLEKLRTLNLGYNEIHHIDNAAFAGFDELSVLILTNNCLTSIPQGTESIWSKIDLTNNSITSVGDVGKLKHLRSVTLTLNKIPCDCNMREIKEWMVEANKELWTVPCMVGGTGNYKLVQYAHWDNLTCPSPDVSVTTDNGAVTGNVSFTCQTSCKKGLNFSWIAPNGDHRPSSYEYSRNYTNVSKLSCKGSNITTLETKIMCYSVLNIPLVDNGTFTCKVTADHTDNAKASVAYQGVTTTQGNKAQPETTTVKPNERSTGKHDPQSVTWAGRPRIEIIFTVLAGCGCSLIIAAIAACVRTFRGARQTDDRNAGNGASNAQCLGTIGPTESHYENDDQCLDTGLAAEGHTDQFSGNGADAERDYENDDQFTDTEGARGGHYENDDQFLDTGEARGGHYENDDQFTDAIGARGGHYENDDQFTDARGASAGHYENDDQFTDTERARGGHCENGERFSHECGAASTAQQPGHYANDKKVKALDTRASEGGENSDSDHEYITFPTANTEDPRAGERNEQRERDSTDKEPISRTSSGATSSEHEYITLPGTENAEDQLRDTLEHCNDKESDPGIASSDEDNQDHTYVTFPGTKK
ncbi:hypothetical protein Bbelb_345030 [Branchiostoma belcheri]|nr:hypothetical protein Bbelb_345030 [Branchiostoma belcheri]